MLILHYFEDTLSRAYMCIIHEKQFKIKYTMKNLRRRNKITIQYNKYYG